MKADLAIYGSHNAAAALAIDGKIEVVIELERLLNHKNVGMFMYFSADCWEYVMGFLRDYIVKHYGIEEYDTVIVDYCNSEERKYFPAKNYIGPFHHQTHAYGSLYQSPHRKALIFSFDGGGNDGVFNVYLGEKKKDLTLLEQIPTDLGFAYMCFGDRLEEIKRESMWYGNLVYPGKLMGLCAYGNVNEEWLPHFKDFYFASPEGPTYESLFIELGKKAGIDFYPDRIGGQLGRDIAATSQKAFEETFLFYATRWLEKYPNLPVHMTGGCALNIILNTRLVQEFDREVFVTPNPSDCGLTVGMLCQHLKPKKPVDITYAGIPVLDPDLLPSLVEKHASKLVDMNQVAHDLNAGKIVGVVRGRAEHGPRALGNRSILCNPKIPDMKDILNEKVKHREPYRPFAPVVRLEDINTYFEWEEESRWMTFCPKVREEYKEILAAIVHADGTARVQTVTKEQNAWLYDLLTEFAEISGVGVLLNTSFNVKGNPILSSYTDAMDVYKNEQLDRLILGDFYFDKDKYFPPEFS